MSANGDGQRPHRPSLYADLTALIDAASASTPGARAEIASATAAVVVQAGRSANGYRSDAAGRPTADPPVEDFIDLADRVGLDTLAALWRDSDPVSLPGALWALYLLRQWCHSHTEEVSRLWRAGEHVAAADAVVAGVAEYPDPESVQQVADAVLSGAYRGDFAVALERAAALFRVVAAGRRELATSDPPSHAELQLAARNDRVADALSAAAERWRSGTLH